MRIKQENLPIDEATQELAIRLGVDAAEWAYYGGEDYELLAAVPPSRMAEARRRLERVGLAVCEVGVVTDEPGIVAVTAAGDVRLDEQKAFSHFSAARPME